MKQINLLVEIEDQDGSFKMKNIFLILIVAIISLSCENDKKWTKILNDNDLNGWHYYNDNGNKFGWSVSNGVLSFDPTKGRFQSDSDGNILTHGNGNPKKKITILFLI